MIRYQRQKWLSRWVLMVASLAALAGLSGCTSHRAGIKGARTGSSEEQAMQAFREGAELLFVDNTEARAKFVEASELWPTMFEAYFNAGVASEALGQDQEAAKFYEACLAQKKDQPACLGNLLLVRVRLGDAAGANALAQQYLAEYPEEPFAMAAAAELAFAQNNLTDAEKYARMAIERDAENTQALEIMGRIFFAQKKYAAAKLVAKNALEQAPAHGGLHLLLGHTYAKLGLLHDALDSYAAAVKYMPTEEALESYGLLLMKRGRVSESLPVLKRLSELRPLDYRNQLHLGNGYMANKQFDGAKAAYEKALELAPDQKDINLNLGLLYFDFKPEGLPELDRMKKALGYFQAYLDQPSVSKERLDEVNRYVTSLKDKIAYEEDSAKESAAAAAKAAEEEAAEPKLEAEPTEEPEKPAEEQPGEEPAPANEPEEEVVPPAPNEEEPLPEPVKAKEEEPKLPKEEPLLEEEPFFDEPLEEEAPEPPVKKSAPNKKGPAKPSAKKPRDEEDEDGPLFDEDLDEEPVVRKSAPKKKGRAKPRAKKSRDEDEEWRPDEEDELDEEF